MSADWPVHPEALARGRQLVLDARGSRVAIACDHDVDGLASAVLLGQTIERLGGQAVIVPVERGEHIHVAPYRDRVASHHASAYAVTDMGSRPEPFGLPAPTLLLDHHDSDLFPPDAVVVSSARRQPVAPTSYLAYELARGLTPVEDLDWVALLGSVADLGDTASFGLLPAWRRRYRAKHVAEAVALLNAARRSAAHDVTTALGVLRRASTPADIAHGHDPGVERLRELRAEVAAEVERVARTPPRLHGDVALIRICSKAQVHPLLAVRWKRRLSGKIVLVANDEFLPGRVNFAVRTTRSMDLIAWLRSLPIGPVGPDFARGHPAATGGSLTHEGFDRLLIAIGAGKR